ncbi:hypothetical protein FZC76_00720 [Sutcliffiella horikoshii]|uniref:Uncharacterized protein n=1 Tax=Sutcliffiella horikoshii TaxID=79883 RepID=A0A5D4T4A9_9BACI|nr:hypothetical protein [Sutcliffiella horikoshii]TYS70453.1 hypothetical protein FZC76_00720 [Sutcliffiella horikoshii]
MQNQIGAVLKVVGSIVIALGLLLGIIGGSQANSFLFFVTTFLGSLVTGMALIGMSEIIRILEVINENIPKRRRKMVRSSNDILFDVSPQSMSTKEEDDIKEFLQKHNVDIEKIIPTPKEDFFIIKTSARYILIEMGSFTPKIIDEEKWPEDLVGWFEQYNQD